MEGQGIITSVERQKKHRHRYHIFVDEQFAFAIHEDILMKHRLFKGQTVNAGQLEEVLRDEERQDAYLRAIRWLGTRQRTAKEIRSYLARKEYEEAVIDDCLSRLEAERYVDDERFSLALAEERIKLQGKGKQWVRQELLHKGVDKSMVQEAVASIDAKDEADAAGEVAHKRWKTLSKEEDRLGAKRKLYAYLTRRGFSASAVRKAVHAAMEGESGDEREEDGGWE